MKKLMTICLCAGLLTAALPAVPAAALPMMTSHPDGTPYASALELIESWNGDYPEWYCGVWTETGDPAQLCIGILEGDAGEQGMADVRTQITDPDSVTFVTQQYNLALLEALMEEVNMKLKTGAYPEIYGCGLDMKNNCVCAYGAFAEPTPETSEFAAFFSESYGDAFRAEEGGEIVPTVGGYPDDMDSLPEWNGGFVPAGTTVPAGMPEEPVGTAPPVIFGGAEVPDGAVPAYGTVPETADHDPDAGDMGGWEIGAVAEEESISADAGGAAPIPNPVLTPGLNGTPAADRTFLRILTVFTALLLIGIPAVIFIRRRQRAARTNAGTVTAQTGTAKTEALLRQQTETPPPALRNRIIEQIRHDEPK